MRKPGGSGRPCKPPKQAVLNGYIHFYKMVCYTSVKNLLKHLLNSK